MKRLYSERRKGPRSRDGTGGWTPVAKISVVKLRVTVPVTNGWKAITLTAGALHELFISTTFTKEDLGKAFVDRKLVHLALF